MTIDSAASMPNSNQNVMMWLKVTDTGNSALGNCTARISPSLEVIACAPDKTVFDVRL